MLADKLRAATAAVVLPEFVSSSTNQATGKSSITITAPTGIQDGDLLVAILVSSSLSDLTVIPTGFSRQAYVSAENPIDLYAVCTKIAASEGANYTFNVSSSGNLTATILVYRNATRVNTVGDVAYFSSTPTSTATAITPSYRGMLLAFFSVDSTKTITTPPSGMTLRASNTASAPSIGVYELEQEAASTGAKSLVWDSNGSGLSALLQITNEPDVTPDFVASASTQNPSTSLSTLTIDKPTGTVEGDLMVAFLLNGGGTTTGWSNAESFTEAGDALGRPIGCIAYKVAGASEGASYTFTCATSGRTLAGSILTYRYAAYDTIGAATSGSDPLILPSVSPSESQSILIAIGARDSASITVGTSLGMTAQITDNGSTLPSYTICDQTVAKGPTGTRSVAPNSSTNVNGIMLSIKPTRSL